VEGGEVRRMSKAELGTKGNITENDFRAERKNAEKASQFNPENQQRTDGAFLADYDDFEQRISSKGNIEEGDEPYEKSSRGGKLDSRRQKERKDQSGTDRGGGENE